MDLFLFRRLIASNLVEVCFDLPPSEQRRYCPFHFYNHPLVISECAFWKTNKTLVVGYVLFRRFISIFSSSRNECLSVVHRDLLSPYQVSVRNSRLRKLCFSELSKLLAVVPVDVINYICSYCY